ncbi:unnamed protein product [Boreogadus saida]
MTRARMRHKQTEKRICPCSKQTGPAVDDITAVVNNASRDQRGRQTRAEHSRGSSVARLGRISRPIWQPWLNWFRQGCKIGWKIWPNLATPPGSSTLLLGDHNTERSRRNESDKPGMNSATIRYNPSSPMNLSD